MKAILFTISEQIKNISILLNPIIPFSTGKVLDAMNINSNNLSIQSINKKDIFSYDKKLKDLDILFKKIDYDN